MKIKKTLKKTLALLLCLATVCSFAACAPADKDETTAATSGSGENNTTAGGETEKVEITYAFWGSEEEAANTQEVLDIYNASQDRTHVTAVAILWEAYMEKLNTMAAGGNLPDCGLMSEAGVLQFAEMGLLADVSSMYDDAEEKPMASATYTYQGKEIAYASANNSLVMYYNKDMFDAAGVPYPPANAEDAWTWEEFVDVAKKLTLDANGNNAASPDFDPNNIVQYAVPTSWFYTNNTTDFNTLLGSILGEVWTGGMTAEQAINENYDALVAAYEGMGA